MIHVYGSVTRDKEKYALSALTSVCIKQVNFSEKENEVFFGTDEIVRYIHCTLYIKRVSVERGYTVPETWKRYHFRAEPPCIDHNRKYLLRGVTSHCLQSGDQQLEPISTDSTCIGWVSHLYMNMFKMLELWCPWKASSKFMHLYGFFHCNSLVLFTIPVFALVCGLLSFLYMYILFVASYIVQ